MDRHQFVEKLIGMRDAKKQELDKALLRRDKAFKVSATRLKKVLKKSNKPSDLYTVTINSNGIAYGASGRTISSMETLDEKAKVTDDDIITLCGDIVSLERKVAKMNNKAIRYEKENVSEMFQTKT